MGYLGKLAKLFQRRAAGPVSAHECAPPALSMPRVANDAAAKQAIAAANQALERKDYAAAVDGYLAAIEIRHDDADAHCALGVAYLKLQRDEEAEDSFTMAAHFNAELAEPHYYLARIAQADGNFAAAILHVGRALERRPDYADAYNLLGACALQAGDPARAVDAFAKAVERNPGNAHFRSNLGYVLLRDIGEFELGAAHLRAALEIDRNDPSILCNYCSVLLQEGRLGEVVSICNRLLEGNPRMHEARLNRALAMLKQGHFGDAWSDYEARRYTRSNYSARPFEFREWRGEPLSGKVVLVCREQGLGDEIMFASCIGEIVSRAANCIVDCSPRLAALFARSFPQAVVHGAEQSDTDIRWLKNAGSIDYQIGVGSLPGFFRPGLDDFPEHDGYLRADPMRTQKWKARLESPACAMTVGIAWRGGMASTRRSMRSLELRTLLPVLRTAGVRFVSVQHDATLDEIETVCAGENIKLDHWPEVVADIDETSALISALDLVISVCSTPVHLTGALGRPAWVMVPAVAEWRYLDTGERMPWYPGVRMFRQAQSGDWQPVIQAIARELAEFGAK